MASAGNEPIARVHLLDSLRGRANARHLAGCWNALDGIDTAEVERMDAVGHFGTVRILADQRDELIAALRLAHRTADTLLAALILKDHTFLPSKSGIWPDIVKIATLLRKYSPARSVS